MEPVDNNRFEVVPPAKSKRKLPASCSNVYLNPALDLLINDDPMCNNKMEVVPKKRKRTRSCDITTFENTALDLGISKAAVNEFLMKELNNVKNLEWKGLGQNNLDTRYSSSCSKINPEISEPIYANLNSSDPCLALPREVNEIPKNTKNNAVIPMINETFNVSHTEMDSGISIIEQKSLNPLITFNEISAIGPADDTITSNSKTTVNQIFINNQTNMSLSFIDRLALDSSNVSNQSLYLDDDLNESNIMEIKTITIITKKKRVPERLPDKKKNTNPFLNNSLDDNIDVVPAVPENPFLFDTGNPVDMDYSDQSVSQTITNINANMLMPRRLFTSDVNSTVSTVNEAIYSIANEHNEYENIDSLRSESPIYENIADDSLDGNYNKQSKILGYDVSQFSAKDIMNLNKLSNTGNTSNESNDKKESALKFFKPGKLSKKVFKKIKQTFKHEKPDPNVTLNPYEVPRKPCKQVVKTADIGIENPCLNLDNSDEFEMEEIDNDEEHQYETIKTLRNTRLNMNVTPLRERINDLDFSENKSNTPGKKTVRFDSTLNQEKVITGDSFDYGIQSPGFDAKLEKYHDELENCINEKKFIQQNM